MFKIYETHKHLVSTADPDYWEVNFCEYDDNYDLRRKGTEDFTTQRFKLEKLRTYFVYIWDGKKMWKNGYKCHEDLNLFVCIKQKDLKLLKEYIKAKYPRAVEVKLKPFGEL